MAGKIYHAAWLPAAVSLSQSCASAPIPAIAGKDEWIFSGLEQIKPAEVPHTTIPIELIRCFNEVLARSGLTMVPAMAWRL
jgi:hypothetical protein